jgi:hypothetical protein
MPGWIVVRVGKEKVSSPNSFRIIETVKLSDEDLNPNPRDINLDRANAAGTLEEVRQRYAGRLAPRGNYYIFVGLGSEELTPELLEMMQR